MRKVKKNDLKERHDETCMCRRCRSKLQALERKSSRNVLKTFKNISLSDIDEDD